MLPFIQVMVMLIARYLKFSVSVETRTFSSGVADENLSVKPLWFTWSRDGALYLRDIKAKS